MEKHLKSYKTRKGIGEGTKGKAEEDRKRGVIIKQLNRKEDKKKRNRNMSRRGEAHEREWRQGKGRAEEESEYRKSSKEK